MTAKPRKKLGKKVDDLRARSLSARKARDVKGGCDAGSKDASNSLNFSSTTLKK